MWLPEIQVEDLYVQGIQVELDKQALKKARKTLTGYYIGKISLI